MTIHKHLCPSCPFNSHKHEKAHGGGGGGRGGRGVRDGRLAPLRTEREDARVRAEPELAETIIPTNSAINRTNSVASSSAYAYSILSSPVSRLINSSSAPSDISDISVSDASQLLVTVPAQPRISRRGNTQTHELTERVARARVHPPPPPPHRTHTHMAAHGFPEYRRSCGPGSSAVTTSSTHVLTQVCMRVYVCVFCVYVCVHACMCMCVYVGCVRTMVGHIHTRIRQMKKLFA